MTVKRESYILGTNDVGIVDPALAYVTIIGLWVEGIEFDPSTTPGNREYKYTSANGSITINLDNIQTPAKALVIYKY